MMIPRVHHASGAPLHTVAGIYQPDWKYQRLRIAIKDEQARTGLLEEAVRHVLRRGKIGKQSEARLRAAIRAIEISRG